MTIIVGLGNIGNEYRQSRHNAGFRVLEELERVQGSGGRGQWKLEKALEAETIELGKSLLVKPQTFMNLSGRAVAKIMKKYDYGALGKKDFSKLFVVYDDLDIPVGKYKLVFGSGPKVHNGVNSIKETLGSDQFWHVRVGVDGRGGDRSVPSDEYVLSGFRDDEKELFARVVDGVASFLSDRMNES